MKTLARASLVPVAVSGIVIAILFSALAASGLTPYRVGILVVGVGAALLTSTVALSVNRFLGDETPRMVARQLGERGQSIPQIARHLNISQDAVRGMLGADLAAVRNPRRGNNCRKARRS